MALFNYECDEVKHIIDEVSPNYPQLTTFEKEWLYFHKYGYIPGVPVELEYESVNVNPTGMISNAIPHKYKSAILKGNTLVNLFKNKDTHRDTSKFIYVEEGDKIQVTFKDGVTNGWIGFSFNENVPFEIGKTYTVMNELYKCDDQLMSFGISFGNKIFTNTNPVIGINKLKITIPSDYTEGINWMYYNLNNTNNSATIFSSNLLILEGDYTQEDIPYFEGMQSVKMPVLTTSNEDGTKTNILTVNEDVELRGIGNVKDELNLLTGELTQRIGEVEITGDETFANFFNDGSCVKCSFARSTRLNGNGGLMCDKLPINNILWGTANTEGIRYYEGLIHIAIDKTRLESYDATGVSNYIKSIGGLHLIYKEPTPIIKTVDLTPLNNPYEGTNHYELTSDIPCEAILEVPVVSTGKQTLEEINN